jgi:phage terminase small subunit
MTNETKPKLKTPRRKPDHIAKLRESALSTAHEATAALVSEDKELTPQQNLFVKYWAEGDTVGNALVRAGYAADSSYGYRMTKMPNILRAKAEYHRLYVEVSTKSKRDVMEMLQEAFDMAKLMAEPATMVSAAREIGKMCGYYEPVKVDVAVNLTGALKLEQMSDAELYKMIESAIDNEQSS